jgi:glycosyltransferase involved in cell wall biosynthesis
MPLPILFDITHLTSRCQVRPHTGIDRVDIAFAKALAAMSSAPVMGLHCRLARPHLLSRRTIDELAQKAASPGPSRKSDDLAKQFIHDWLTGPPQAGACRISGLPSYSTEPSLGYQYRRQLRLLLPVPSHVSIPPEAIYLNIAPFGTPGPIYFRWLKHRPKVKAVFFVHDLLPIDRPDLFPPSWQPFHERMASVIMTRASGIIVASDVVRERVELELKRHGRHNVRIHVAHLPASSTFLAGASVDSSLQAHPYFVMCSTIEPRKNHRLLLELWRRFSEEEKGNAPRLILVGKRGWKNEQVTTALDHDLSLRSVVLEATAVSDPMQQWLLSNACAALFPSLAEGYGLPLVEALSLGIPAVASDIPVLREVSQGCAMFCDPTDRQAWTRTILSLRNRSSSVWKAAAAKASEYRSPTSARYFAAIMEFLDTL